MYYEIPEYRFEKFEKELKKLETKCKQYNCDFHYTKGERILKKFDQDGQEVIINVIPVEVDAKAVQNGWKYVASIEHYDNGNIILAVDDSVDIPEKYRTVEGICEHCNTKRNRKFTVLVQNIETKELKQVGRNCVLEYTQGLTPAMLKQLESLMDLVETTKKESESARIPVEEVLIDVIELWSTAYNVIRKFGYWEKKPGSKDRYTTIDRVNYLMSTSKCNNLTMGEKIQKAILESKRTDITMANYKTLAKERYIRQNDIELAIKAVVHYHNYEKYKREKTQSEYQGEPGDVLEFKVLKTKLISSFPSQFDENRTINLYEFLDENHNIYLWFTEKGYLKSGDHGYILTGTVKKHKVHDGAKQTVLTHCHADFSHKNRTESSETE